MNNDISKGQWKQVKGTVRKQWGKLTNNNKDKAAGSYGRVTGKLQKGYGEAKQKAGNMIHKMKP